ncbi:MAG: hypothetical protein A4E73_03871 [Syntrophaceae bacterium PtaU1.Bin231]|nr:MAG: hypothetical protein A4E73_03871 [Syntrophaceae bacterium PtaU1.Bin231]
MGHFQVRGHIFLLPCKNDMPGKTELFRLTVELPPEGSVPDNEKLDPGVLLPQLLRGMEQHLVPLVAGQGGDHDDDEIIGLDAQLRPATFQARALRAVPFCVSRVVNDTGSFGVDAECLDGEGPDGPGHANDLVRAKRQKRFDAHVSRAEPMIGGVHMPDHGNPPRLQPRQAGEGAGIVTVAVDHIDFCLLQQKRKLQDPAGVVIGRQPQDPHRDALSGKLVGNLPAPGQAPDLDKVLSLVQTHHDGLDDPLEPPDPEIFHDMDNGFPICHHQGPPLPPAMPRFGARRYAGR